MGNEENTIPKHILKELSTLIRVIRKNKNLPREREYSQFFCGKNMNWMSEMILNVYKIK